MAPFILFFDRLDRELSTCRGFPGAFYLHAAGAQQGCREGKYVLRNLSYRKALVLIERNLILVQMTELPRR